MIRRLLVAITALTLTTGVLLVGPPAGAHHRHDQRGELYEKGSNNVPYSFDDSECGFTVHVEGRFRNRYKIYRVRGSDQAFFAEDRYAFREVLTNPANGKRMYVSGRAFFREVRARQIEGDVYEFIAVESGTPFVVRNRRGRVVLADRGTVVTRTVQDTLGDGVPGSEQLEFEILRTRGHFPSFAEDFDFCALVTRLIG